MQISYVKYCSDLTSRTKILHKRPGGFNCVQRTRGVCMIRLVVMQNASVYRKRHVATQADT